MIDQNNATRIKLLKLWEILVQETDEEHPLSSNALIEKLSENGISVTRKTLYRDIETLNECGYEVMCERSRNNEYYVADRKFNMPELHIMLDAVQAASFITKRKTKELVDKIAALGGSRRGEVMKRNIVAFNTAKNTNEAIYYSVSEIVTAIKEQRKIIFLYFDYDHKHEKVYRRNGHHYVISPIATVFSEDNYYVITYDQRFGRITHYRIDRMDQVTMIEDSSDPIPEDVAFSISKHKKQVFGMFTGDTQLVTFEVDHGLLDIVFDKFGENIKLTPVSETRYSFNAEVQISPIFFGWCGAFKERLQVVSPQTVVDSLRDYYKDMADIYGK